MFFRTGVSTVIGLGMVGTTQHLTVMCPNDEITRICVTLSLKIPLSWFITYIISGDCVEFSWRSSTGTFSFYMVNSQID